MKIILNAKVDPQLKEALRLVAQDESVAKTISSSSLLVEILKKDQRVAAKLKMLLTR